MKAELTYLRMEIKRTLQCIPSFLTGAIVLVVLASTIAFSASKLLYGERAVGMVEVGVVLPEEDLLAEKAVQMVSSLESVGNLCHFTYLDGEEGREMLKRGELFALMELPQDLIRGIMDGRNLPVTVLFPEQSGLEAAVFRELTEAGSSMLRTAQAGIYATDDYLASHGRAEAIPQAEEELNTIFLRYALSRGDLFRVWEVSATGQVETPVYYGISAAVLLLLLLGIPAAPLLRSYSRAMEDKLTLLGIGRGKRTAVRFFCLLLLLLLASCIPVAFLLVKGYLAAGAVSLLMWVLICAVSSGWTLFLYELCRSEAAAILLAFFSAVVMVFAAGGILPSVFLPEAVSRFGDWTLAAWMADGFRWMMTGQGGAPAGKLAAAAVGTLCLAALARRGGDEA